MRTKREDADDRDLFKKWRGKWSGFVTVMKPSIRKDKNGSYEERNGDGYRLRRSDMEKLDLFSGDDGIYEWRIRETREVVYVGKSESSSDCSVLDRVDQYCTDGSHLATKIDKVLEEGQALQVRVLLKIYTGEDAGEMEKEVLKKYKYPWNRRS
uniref:uncharacterized protein LOC120343409 n=1 Tax=Styela clava TaxID=7725 RepID=UPI00193AB3C2|nr:uncharacterized protein LOC120343409 [Styela clava]